MRRREPVDTALVALAKECDARLEQYRAALDAGADPGLAAAWIAEPRPTGPARRPNCIHAAAVSEPTRGGGDRSR